jgi:uncharacterized protein (TIGR02145 family)
MSENLKATLYSDGTEILHVTDSALWSNNSGPAYCWPDTDPQWKERGALYNWYTVETGKLCPAGWHVPSDKEWRQLEFFLGMDESVALTDGFRGKNEGGMLKTTSLWDSPNAGATDELGFKAIPTGRIGDNGEFLYLNAVAFFWSRTLDGTNRPIRRLLYYENGQISRVVATRDFGLSVRCVKDK